MFLLITLISEFILLACEKASDVIEAPDALAILLIGIASAAVFLDFSVSRSLRDVRYELTAGYLLRMFLLLFDIFGRNIFILPNSGSDTEMFYRGAIAYMKEGGWTRTYLANVTGTLMRLIGTNRLYMQYLLTLSSVVALCALARILETCGIEKRLYKRALLFAGLFPNFAVLSVVYLRESIVTMFVALSVLCFVKWTNKHGEMWFWAAFALVFAGAQFHSGILGIAVGYIVIRFLYDNAQQRFHFKAKNVLLAALFIAVFAAIFFSNPDGGILRVLRQAQSLGDIANTYEMGSSAYTAYVGNSDSVGNIIIYTLPRMFYFLFSPLPWQWRSLSDVLAFMFDSLFYILAIWNALKAILRAPRKRTVLVRCLLITALCMTFIFGWAVTNAGTALRHRDKMVILYAVIWVLSRGALSAQKKIYRSSRGLIGYGRTFAQRDRAGIQYSTVSGTMR